MSKTIFKNIYHLLDPNWSQIKSAQNLLEFGTTDVSNISISILMSKIVFIKYLPPVRPKLVPKLKMLRMYLYLGTFDILNSPISGLMQKIIFMKYLPPVWPKLVTKLKVLRIYWNLANLLFQICQSRFWYQKWFLWNTYLLLGPNSSQNKKCPRFIEIWHIWYLEYPNLNFDVKN